MSSCVGGCRLRHFKGAASEREHERYAGHVEAHGPEPPVTSPVEGVESLQARKQQQRRTKISKTIVSYGPFRRKHQMHRRKLSKREERPQQSSRTSLPVRGAASSPETYSCEVGSCRVASYLLTVRAPLHLDSLPPPRFRGYVLANLFLSRARSLPRPLCRYF